MQNIFAELAALSNRVLLELDLDEEQAATLAPSFAEPDRREIAFQATVLLAVVLAAAVAAVPGSDESVAWFGRELLQESIFIGKATHGAYVELSRVLPDDNVLGWAGMLAWLLRWLKGASGDDTTPGRS